MDRETKLKVALQVARDQVIQLREERDKLLAELSTRPLPSGNGTPIGVTDIDGRQIHIGDTLSFDEKEWGSPMEFVIKLEAGQIIHPGATGDLRGFCTIVKKWHEA